MLPSDMDITLARILICSNKFISVENYLKVLEYTNELIKIKTKEYVVEIKGDNLNIKHINSEDIHIQGRIFSIEYLN